MERREHTRGYFGGPSLHKLVAASAVVIGHAGAILALGHLGPSPTGASHFPPLEIVLVPAAVAAELPPPPFNIEQPRIDLDPPLVPMIELITDSPAASSAITVAAVPAAALARPPGEAAPELVSEVEYLDPPRPGYPSVSRRLGEQGLVILRVLVDERGHAEQIEVHRSSGHARLDQAALVAVERAEFKPYLANGAPRRVYVLVPIEFALGRASNPHG